jgi:hypothetical protein
MEASLEDQLSELDPLQHKIQSVLFLHITACHLSLREVFALILSPHNQRQCKPPISSHAKPPIHACLSLPKRQVSLSTRRIRKSASTPICTIPLVSFVNECACHCKERNAPKWSLLCSSAIHMPSLSFNALRAHHTYRRAVVFLCL